MPVQINPEERRAVAQWAESIERFTEVCLFGKPAWPSSWSFLGQFALGMPVGDRLGRVPEAGLGQFVMGTLQANWPSGHHEVACDPFRT